MDHGFVASFCDNHEDISCHYLLRLQSAGRNLRAIDGDRRVIWEDGRHSGSSSSRIFSQFTIFRCVRTGHAMYNARYLRFSRRRGSPQRDYAPHSISRSDHV